MSEERFRLFVALVLPPEVCSALDRWRAAAVGELTGLRPVARDALHVTLCFLGSRSAADVGPIGAACAVASSDPQPELSAAGGIWLSPRRPHVLAVSLSDRSGGLARIQSNLSDALANGGWYAPEKRPFLAHVTVARVARNTRVRPVELPPPPELTFRGERVALLHSRLGPRGARYEELASVAVGSAGV